MKDTMDRHSPYAVAFANASRGIHREGRMVPISIIKYGLDKVGPRFYNPYQMNLSNDCLLKVIIKNICR